MTPSRGDAITPQPGLTVEDILAAARCVALWNRVGARPLTVARHIREAARRACQYRHVTGQMHPQIGDGSVMAAAAALMPSRRPLPGRAVSTLDLLHALGPVSVALATNALPRG